MWHSIGHQLYVFWYGYTYPSLKGNGPEALFQTVLYGAIAIAFIPLIRKFLRSELAKANGEVKKIEEELLVAEHWLLRLVKSPARLVKALKRVKITVTPAEATAIKAVGTVVETVDPALAPEVHVVEGVVSSQPAPPSTTMASQ